MATISLFAGSVPANYDKYLGPILFEPYALDLVERLQGDDLNHVLELACGTGRVTKHLAQLIPESGTLVATDLNADMIEIAKTKVDRDNVQWMLADAQNLMFENEQFDHVVCQFGVMFFPDKEKSFAEAHRVLKRGGKFLFNTWESVEKNPRIDVMWKVIYEVFENGAPDFLQKGPHSFYDQEKIKQFLRNAGFSNIKVETVEKNPSYTEPGDLIKGFADGSPLRNYLQEKGEEAQAAFRKRLQEELSRQDEIYGNTVPSLALVVEAVK
jgi:ubiquinone/menaquinone biosynthesis C-methylase UbiE